MNKDEILKVAQTEKLDEGRKYINEDIRDLLSLLIGMIGAFCYGKFVLTSKMSWFIAATILLVGAGFYYLQLFGI